MPAITGKGSASATARPARRMWAAARQRRRRSDAKESDRLHGHAAHDLRPADGKCRLCVRGHGRHHPVTTELLPERTQRVAVSARRHTAQVAVRAGLVFGPERSHRLPRDVREYRCPRGEGLRDRHGLLPHQRYCAGRRTSRDSLGPRHLGSRRQRRALALSLALSGAGERSVGLVRTVGRRGRLPRLHRHLPRLRRTRHTGSAHLPERCRGGNRDHRRCARRPAAGVHAGRAGQHSLGGQRRLTGRPGRPRGCRDGVDLRQGSLAAGHRGRRPGRGVGHD